MNSTESVIHDQPSAIGSTSRLVGSGAGPPAYTANADIFKEAKRFIDETGEDRSSLKVWTMHHRHMFDVLGVHSRLPWSL